MDAKGKGSLLLLLVMSGLLLCTNVASMPTCPNRDGCWEYLQDLFDSANILLDFMYHFSSELLQEFNSHYSQSPFLSTPAVSQCHTASLTMAQASLSTPVVQQHSQQMQYKDPVGLLTRLLRSWDDPLFHLVNEGYQLPKMRDSLLREGRMLAQNNLRLQKLLKKISGQFYPEMSDSMDYAVWTELPSLQSTDEGTHLPAFYNLLHCWSTDLQKVRTYLRSAECQVTSAGSC